MNYRGRHRRPRWAGLIVWGSAYVGAWAAFSAYATVVTT